MGKRDTLSLRGEAGYTAAQSRFGIPQEYLFRAGGSQSVRGYAHQSLGVQEGSAMVGGRTLATGSLEYTHWFSGDWGAALFADTGGAADSWRDMRLSTGYGAGARWRSPVGPLAWILPGVRRPKPCGCIFRWRWRSDEQPSGPHNTISQAPGTIPAEVAVCPVVCHHHPVGRNRLAAGDFIRASVAGFHGIPQQWRHT